MHEFRDETGLWATAGSASSAKDLLARGARADDAIPGAAPRKIEPVLPRSLLAAGLWRYGPHAALAAWMIAVNYCGNDHRRQREPKRPGPLGEARVAEVEP
jgi:hypothetical protein